MEELQNPTTTHEDTHKTSTDATAHLVQALLKKATFKSCHHFEAVSVTKGMGKAEREIKFDCELRSKPSQGIVNVVHFDDFEVKTITRNC